MPRPERPAKNQLDTNQRLNFLTYKTEKDHHQGSTEVLGHRFIQKLGTLKPCSKTSLHEPLHYGMESYQ